MRTQLLESFSSESNLQVGVAFGDIIDFRLPITVAPGDPVESAVLLRNTGDTPAIFRIEYFRWDAEIGGTGISLGFADAVVLGGGAQTWIYGFNKPPIDGIDPTIDLMPNRDPVIYRAVAWRNGIADDIVDRTVELLKKVSTTLTSIVEPTQVEKGKIYKQTGRLTRDDTGGGVPDSSIYLERFEDGIWKIVGTTTTDGNGNYVSGDLVAPSPPTTPITYKVRAHFSGSLILGLSPSYSPVDGLVMDGLAYIPVIGSLVLGVILLAVSR